MYQISEPLVQVAIRIVTEALRRAGIEAYVVIVPRRPVGKEGFALVRADGPIIGTDGEVTRDFVAKLQYYAQHPRGAKHLLVEVPELPELLQPILMTIGDYSKRGEDSYYFAILATSDDRYEPFVTVAGRIRATPEGRAKALRAMASFVAHYTAEAAASGSGLTDTFPGQDIDSHYRGHVAATGNEIGEPDSG